jgi:prevent-host-death family protein
MKIASISQTKNKLSHYLDLVRHGETVIIQDRGKPVARLESISASPNVDPTGRLERLERAGLIRRGAGKLPPDFFKRPPPKPKNGGDILRALLQDREEGW